MEERKIRGRSRRRKYKNQMRRPIAVLLALMLSFSSFGTATAYADAAEGSKTESQPEKMESEKWTEKTILDSGKQTDGVSVTRDASANAGFTTGTPWLKVNYNYKKINLESQKNDPDSVYQYYRRLLALRKNPAYAETIVYGDLLPVFENQDRVMAYYRKSADQTLLVIGNYKTQQQTLTLPSKLKHIVLNNLPQLKTEGNEIMLEGYQAVILEMLS